MFKCRASLLCLGFLVIAGCKRSTPPAAAPETPQGGAEATTQPAQPHDAAPRKLPLGPATRQQRNVEALRAEGLIPPEHPPDLDEKTAQIRTPEEAARKCLAWYIVARKSRLFEEARKLPSFRLTERAIIVLRANNLPDAVVTRLNSLKDKPFQTGEELVNELEKLLTKDQLREFQAIVVKAAELAAREQFIEARRAAKEVILKFVADNELQDALNMQERAYLFKPCLLLDDDQLEEDDVENSDFAWHYERVWVLLWALGREKDLGSPRFASNADKIDEKMLKVGTGNIIKKARLRSPGQLLDKYDLMQRNYAAAYHPSVAEHPELGQAYQRVCKEWFIALGWLVGRSSADDPPDSPLTPAERKAQTEEILKEKAIPINANLPAPEDESKIKLRSLEEVVRRMVIVHLLAKRADALVLGQPADHIAKGIESRNLKDHLTPDEKAFLENPRPSVSEIVKFRARHEWTWVMLWTLGYVDPLGEPVQESPDARLRRYLQAELIISELGDNVEKLASLRSSREILDQADFMYRCARAVNDILERGPFVIDDTLLEMLRGRELPELFIGKLHALKDKKFETRKAFSAELEKTLDKEEIANYLVLLINLARQNKPVVLPANLDSDALIQWNHAFRWLIGSGPEAISFSLSHGPDFQPGA